MYEVKVTDEAEGKFHSFFHDQMLRVHCVHFQVILKIPMSAL